MKQNEIVLTSIAQPRAEAVICPLRSRTFTVVVVLGASACSDARFGVPPLGIVYISNPRLGYAEIHFVTDELSYPDDAAWLREKRNGVASHVVIGWAVSLFLSMAAPHCSNLFTRTCWRWC